MSVDPRAATGFGSNTEAYERGRPSYPEDAIDRLFGEFGLSSTSTVLDLAAGTGKLTRQLVPRAGRVLAVEPSPGMRAALTRQVPKAEVLDGTAESIPLEDASIEAVFVGQAFHWFRAEEALAEIARVLEPGGGLALLWNQAQWRQAGLAWLERFRALVEPRRLAAGPFPAGEEKWKSVLERSPLFEPRQDAHFTHTHRIAVEDFVALVASWSWIANLPDQERTAVLADVRELASGHTALEIPYATEVYSCRTRRTC